MSSESNKISPTLDSAQGNSREASKPARRNRRNWLYDSLDLSRWVHHETVIRHVPFVLFLTVLTILYIANTHDARKTVQELGAIEKQLNELRWEYMTSKSELEHLSKQSVVAERTAQYGLKELQEPPVKIVAAEDE